MPASPNSALLHEAPRHLTSPASPDRTAPSPGLPDPAQPLQTSHSLTGLTMHGLTVPCSALPRLSLAPPNLAKKGER